MLNEWNFIAITFNGNSNESILYTNEGFGADAQPLYHFPLDSYDWIAKVFNGEGILLGGNPSLTDEMHSFDGSISCLQIFDYAMNPATLSMKKFCPELPKKYEPCPGDYALFDGICYEVQPSKLTLAQAEVACLPKKNSKRIRRVAFTPNPEHGDFISFLAKETFNTDSIWIGASDIDKDGLFIDSFGENHTSLMYKEPVDEPQSCATIVYGTSG